MANLDWDGPAPESHPPEWPRRLRTGALLASAWLAWMSAGAYQQRGAPFEEVAFGVLLGAVFAVAAVVRE